MSASASVWFQRIHLALLAPVTIALVFLIAPLEAADEQMHLYRANAVSNGTVVPAVTDSVREGKGAGGTVDVALHDWVIAFTPKPDTEITPTSRATLFGSWTGAERVGRETIAHSNTAIYPPLLYGQSAAAIWGARALGLPVVAWFYAARLANALTAIVIFAALMRAMPSFRPFILVVAALPIVLYQTSTLSADAVLLPMVVAFACLLAQVCLKADPRPRQVALLAVATIVLCVGKIAYMPLALLPLIVALAVDRRWSKRAVIFAILAALAVSSWAVWAWAVHDKVFTIRPDVPISPMGQLAWIVAHPVSAIMVLVRSLASNAAFMGYSALGSHLGSLNFRISPAVIVLAAFALIAASLATRIRPEPPRWCSTFVVMLCAALVVVILLLLYLQFNAVAAQRIEGMQGRYFLPLLIVAIPFLPKPRWAPPRWTTNTITMGFAIVSALYMVVRTSQAYWTA